MTEVRARGTLRSSMIAKCRDARPQISGHRLCDVVYQLARRSNEALVSGRNSAHSASMAEESVNGAQKPGGSTGGSMAGFGMYAVPARTLSDEIAGEDSAIDVERAGASHHDAPSRRMRDRLVLASGIVAACLIVIGILYALTPT
jgi:hypothetical protein